MALVLSFFLQVQITLSTTCLDSSCSNCFQKKYRDLSCLLTCPSTYIDSISECFPPSDQNFEVVHIEFKSFLKYSASSISSFSSLSNLPFEDSSKTTPVPTYDRGFYFDSKSFLSSSTGWVMAPHFTFSLFIKVIEEGIILEIQKNLINWMSLEADNEKFLMRMSVFKNDDESNWVRDLSHSPRSPWGTWSLLFIRSKQYFNSVSLMLNDTSGTFNSFQVKMNSNDFSYQLGSQTSSFKGFFYEFFIVNHEDFYYETLENPSSCLFGFYSGVSQCEVCDGSWINCIKNVPPVRSCYSSYCLSCSGFGPEHCLACSLLNTKLCMPGRNCLTYLSEFECITCEAGATLTDMMCIQTRSTLSIKCFGFEPFTQYYGEFFHSGLNPLTYAPYQSPDDDDPFPYYKRGLFFNGSEFLSAPELNLNFKYLIGFWLRSSENGLQNLIISNERLKINTSGSVLISLRNGEGEKNFSIRGVCSFLNTWKVIKVTVRLDVDTATVISECVDNGKFMFSTTGFAFYPTKNMKIGEISSIFFLYKVFISFDPDDSELSSCFSDSPRKLIGTNPESYKNDFLNINLNCDEECENGCSTWGTCNSCLDILCSSCPDGYLSSCQEDQINPCLPGYSLSEDNKKCCHPRCKTCFEGDFSSCFSCREPYVLHDYTCFEICPVSYIKENQDCKTSGPKMVLEIVFNSLSNTFSDIHGNLFYTGANSMFYPDFHETDPIPTFGRGFYFKSTSFIETSEIFLPLNFSLIFWVRVNKKGQFFMKNDLSLNSFLSLSKGSSTFSLFEVNLQKWTRILIWFNSRNFPRDTFVWVDESFGFFEKNVGFFKDFLSKITLGEGFVGFIWQFFIYSGLISRDLVVNWQVCSNSILSNCLVDCDFEWFFDGGQCAACLSSCSDGCKRREDCSLCEILCQDCEKIDETCAKCVENSSFNIVSRGCECDLKFYYKVEVQSCEACTKNCEKCSGSDHNQCTQCSNFILNNMCYEFCPLGYLKTSDKTCEFKKHRIFRLELNTTKNSLKDMESHLEPFGPTEGLQIVLGRGLYFNGRLSCLSYPRQSGSTVFVSRTFYIATWLNPTNSSQVSYLKSSETFSVLIKTESIQVILMEQIFERAFNIQFEKWSHFLINILFSSRSTCKVLINEKIAFVEDFHDLPFLDSEESRLKLGCGVEGYEDFKGFVYNFEIFNEKFDFSFSSKECIGCGLCPNGTHKCLPDCNITEYFQTGSCWTCPEWCRFGCIDNETCQYCTTSNCRSCNKTHLNQCLECSPGFELQSSICNECPEGSFYSTSNKKCLPCPSLCSSCQNLEICMTCKKNSELKSLKCFCEKGYADHGKCIRKNFTVSVSVSQSNEVKLIFNESLSTPLNISSLNISINSEQATFSLKFSDKNTYLIIFTSLPKTSSYSVIISFTVTLTSDENSELITESLHCSLFPETFSSKLKTFTSLSSTFTTSSLVAVGGSSILSMNPTSFFNFINFIEMLSYIILFDIELEQSFVDFINGFRSSVKLPNFIGTFFSPAKDKLPKKYLRVGIENNLFVFNAGTFLIGLFGMFFMFFLFLVVKRKNIRFFERFYRKFESFFRFNGFLRFLLQTCFDVLLVGLIGLRYQRFETKWNYIDHVVICVVITVQFIAILYTFYCLLSFQSPEISLERKVKLKVQFQSLLEEFKSSASLYYMIFIIRRLMISVVIVCMSALVIQLLTSSIFSLMVIFYLIFAAPYKSNYSNFFGLINEILTLVFYLVFLVPLVFGLETTIEDQSLYGTRVILAALGFNMVVNSLQLIVGIFRKIIEKWKNRDHLKTRHQSESIQIKDL